VKLYKRIEANLNAIPSALTGTVFARWCVIDNFGDALNPILIKLICGCTPVDVLTTRSSKIIQSLKGKPDYMVIGSILQWCGKKSVIWGAGFISSSAKLTSIPQLVLAVRGPLTRNKLIKEGVGCPVIYGDPALLLPRFITPNVEKSYSLGIIPHYVDSSHPFIEKVKDSSDVLIIDVQQAPIKVIADILSCENVASSSLHGIIVTDAYKIPSLWLKFSDGVWGNGFKFYDYFSSVGSPDRELLMIQESTNICELVAKAKLYPIELDLDKLWDVCPLDKLQ
jgi:pyruvyltransferase